MFMCLVLVGEQELGVKETFGSTTALSNTNQLRIWTHDNFGENLIINQRNAGI